MRMIFGIPVALFWVLVLVASGQAASPQEDIGLSNEIKYLQAEYVSMTDIATKTLLNSDSAPGMVTVLYGQDLEQLGFSTVGEALGIVPGFSNLAGFGNASEMNIRGISGAYTSGKIKAMVNGLSLNNSADGGVSFYMFPLAHVEKIEIIRGPGSAIYGEWAHLGVINVITRQDNAKLNIQTGSDHLAQAGGHLFYENAGRNLKMNLHVDSLEKDSSGVVAGPDLFGRTEPINDQYKFFDVIFDLKKDNLYLKGYYQDERATNVMGFMGTLPPQEDRYTENYEFFTLETGSRFEQNEYDIKIYGGWHQYLMDWNDLYISLASLDDFQIGPHYREESFYSGLEISRNWQQHQFLTGFEYKYIRDIEHWADGNLDVSTYSPTPSYPDNMRFSGEDSWLKEDMTRDVWGAFIQDQFQFIESLSVVAGLRYDRYKNNAIDSSATDERISPRLATVFQWSRPHILKVQYAEAFRPPTFLEMYFSNNPMQIGNPDLHSEEVNTWEIGYIYNRLPYLAKITLFRSQLKNMIGTDSNGFFGNISNVLSTGAEFEFEWRLNNSYELKSNLSYADTEDESTGQKLPGTAEWLANISLQYHHGDTMHFAILYCYTDSIIRSADDAWSREALAARDSVDLAASFEHVAETGFTLGVGMKNVFDEPDLIASDTYIYDFPQPRRQWWLKLSYDFN